MIQEHFLRLWFTNKNPEKLITHIGTNDIQKIFDLIDCYVKNFSKIQDLSLQRFSPGLIKIFLTVT